MGKTIWFRFTPTINTRVEFFAGDSAIATRLYVYTGNAVNALTEIACADDEISFFLLEAGVTYHIQAGPNDGQEEDEIMLVATGLVIGTPPTLINYQGLLTNPGTGAPVADGDYSITFRIFDAPTGPAQLWLETQTVAVSGGLFNVLLGSNVFLPPSLVPQR